MVSHHYGPDSVDSDVINTSTYMLENLVGAYKAALALLEKTCSAGAVLQRMRGVNVYACKQFGGGARLVAAFAPRSPPRAAEAAMLAPGVSSGGRRGAP